MARRRKKTSDAVANWDDVSSGLPAEGEYIGEAIEVEFEAGDGDMDGEGFGICKWKMKILEGPYKNSTVYDNTRLNSKAMWKAKKLGVAMGLDLEGEFEPSQEYFEEWLNIPVAFEVTHREWDGKTMADVGGYLPADQYDGGEGEEEEEEVDETPKRESRKTSRRSARKADPVEEDDEDEEEEEKPTRKKRSSRGAKRKETPALTDADIKKMDEEELLEAIEEHELDVDLDDYRTLTKKRNAVIEAADDAGILEE